MLPALQDLNTQALHPIGQAASFIVGRNPNANLPVTDTGCSRTQFRIARTPAGYMIESLSAKVATYCDGQPVRAPMALRNGAVIQSGALSFRFLLTAAAVQSTVANPYANRPPPLPVPAPVEEPPPRSFTPWIVAASCATALVVGIVVFLVVRGDRKTETAHDEHKTEAQPATPAPTVIITKGDAVRTESEPVKTTLTPAQILNQFGPSVAFVSTQSGSGSGFLMTDHLVVTNSHVVEGSLSDRVKVAFPDSDKPEALLDAELVYEDRTRDLAVLKVPAANSTPLALASTVERGEQVVVIGSPGTEGGKVSKNHITGGLLSSVSDRTYEQLFYVIDASINPGNSGGPVFDDRGHVIGVATQHIVDKQHMNFIVPFEDVDKAVQKAKRNGDAEIASLHTRHDAKISSARIFSALLVNDGIQTRYEKIMIEALKRKVSERPALSAVKKEWLEPTQQAVAVLATPPFRQALARLSGGDGAASCAADLRRLSKMFEESQALAARPEDNTPKEFLNRNEELAKNLDELIKSIPKALNVPDLEYRRLVSKYYHLVGGDKLAP